MKGAIGIRDSVGFTWLPDTGEMWFTDNGPDMLGDDIPPGELNRIASVGAHYDYPFCHAGEISNPEFGYHGDCRGFRPPAQKLAPYVAPLGIEFYTGNMFPAEYRVRLFISEHGFWNRTKKIRYQITTVMVAEDSVSDYEVFADGWLRDEQVSGRPVDLMLPDDGSMRVSDNLSGDNYRISYKEP